MPTKHALPTDANSVLYEGLYDPAGHQFVTKEAGTVATDSDGNAYAPQVVSGTVTANAGTNLNTSTLALESGGNLATVATNTTTTATNTATTATNTGTIATNTTGLSNAVGTAGSVLPSKGVVVQGSDGTNARALKTDSSGNVNVNVQGTVPVSGTFYQATQPVSGTVTANQGGNWTARVVGSGGATLDSTVGAGSAPSNALAVAALYNSSAPAPTSGQSLALQLDQAGSLRTSPGIALSSLAAWTSATAQNTTATIFANSGVPAVLVQLDQTTTITAGAITFEVSYDGTNWVSPPANTLLDPSSLTYAQLANPYTLQASTNKAFIVSSNGWQALRLRLSTAITGTGSVTPYYALLPFEPVLSSVVYSPTAANFQVTANAGTNLNTSALALESGGHLANVDTNTSTTATNTTGLVTGANVALSSPPATLTAGADTSLTFSSQVRHIIVQNKSTADVYIDFDTAAGLGSLLIPGSASQLVQFDLPCTVLHCYCASALNVNGSTSANLVVKGRA